MAARDCGALLRPAGGPDIGIDPGSPTARRAPAPGAPGPVRGGRSADRPPWRWWRAGPARRGARAAEGQLSAPALIAASSLALAGRELGRPCNTLYPQLEITGLAPHGDAGQVTTRATIRNQHGQLVLDGEHTYLLKTAQHSTPQGAS